MKSKDSKRSETETVKESQSLEAEYSQLNEMVV